MLCEVKTQDRHCSSAFNKNLNLFSVFFASHTKYSVSLQSETNPFFRYFALLIFASFSLRFASKRNSGTPCPHPTNVGWGPPPYFGKKKTHNCFYQIMLQKFINLVLLTKINK